MSTLLTAAAVLGLAGTCQHSFPPERYLGIARIESQVAPDQFDPDAVSKPNWNGTRDYGLMQINERHLRDWGLTTAAAFNPCLSIALAEQVLRQFSAYNSGSPTGAPDYAVRAYIQMHRAPTAQPMSVSTPPAPGAAPDPTPQPPLRDALHAPDSGGLVDLLSGHHPQKPVPTDPPEHKEPASHD